jgi:hypothetical protein
MEVQMAKKTQRKEGNEGGDGIEGVGDALQFATDNTDRLADEIGNAGIFDEPSVTDPLEMLRRKRQKIEGEHEGTRGAVNWLLGVLGIEPSYSDEIGQLDEAEREYKDRDAQANASQQSAEAKKKLLELLRRRHTAAIEGAKSSLEQQSDEIQQEYQQQIDEADAIKTQPYYRLGLGSEAELQRDVQKLKDDAETLRSERQRELGQTSLNQIWDDQGRQKELQLEGAGDSTGAQRQALLNDLYRQREQIDPRDQDRLNRFQKIQDQALQNFDAETARQKKLQQAQSDDELAKYKEEKHEAELRSAGKDDEAQLDALKFSIEQRTKSLREQADAEVDPVRKAQLEREADASAGAEKSDLDALRKQLQRESQPGNPNVTPLRDGKDIAPGFADAVKKLDDAATKLDKALAKAKTVQILAD